MVDGPYLSDSSVDLPAEDAATAFRSGRVTHIES